MRAVVRILSVILVLVCLGSVGAAWFGDAPDLEAEDAIEVAVAAFASVGIEVEPVAPAGADGPSPTMHTPAGGDPVEAWTVLVDADGEVIETRVQKSIGQLVYLDDRIGPEDQERLLTDAQYARLGDYRDDSVVSGWIVRNVLASFALAITAAVVIALVRRADRLWENPVDH